MAEITFERVGKVFPGGTVGVEDFDLGIRDGEFMVLVGPSGSGKSTALRLLAGLESITSGTLRIGDRVVNDMAPRDRDIAMVFQNYALYPHMSVADNMGFALSLRKVPKVEIRRRVADAARLLGIGELLDRKPRQLSGGQRQRVAMGRAIVREPSAFLMDEPLSNLDAKLRVQVRAEIAKLHQELGTTTVYVTHDQVEAMTLGDRVAVMRQGTLQQVDAPQTLYDRPVNLFVAGFIGSPAMNMLPVRLSAEDGRTYASFGSRRVVVPDELASTRGLDAYRDRDLVLGVRPESLEDVEFVPDADPDQLLEVEIDLTEPLGPEVLAHFEVDAPPVRTEETVELAKDLERGEAAEQYVPGEEGRSSLTARLDPRTAVEAGRTAKLAVDVSRLYFFDPTTGEAIW